MIATLPMYDPPWLRAANDRLWSAIADRLGRAGIADVPRTLSRPVEPDEAWRSPTLLLGQTCGYPLVTQLRETVQLVATPRYVAAGCVGAWHRAAIVVPSRSSATTLADLRGTRVGANGTCSNTGMNLLRAAVAPLAAGKRFFSSVVITGSHARSLAALIAGQVDVASIDAVTLAHLRARYPRRAGTVRIIGWTAATPGLPLVTAATTTPETLAALRNALDGVATDPTLEATCHALRIAGFDRLTYENYDVVASLETETRSLGYPALL